VSRVPEIAFSCPSCGKEAIAGLDGKGRCPHCKAEPTLQLAEKTTQDKVVDRCPACGSKQLYVQRDFNQKVGIGIVALGAVLAPFTPFYSSLFAAALLDAALYAVLPEITVCYRCHAHLRGFARNPQHTAFDLHIAEQYDVKAPPQA
jgi:DNA-directed RNA polymerase subunit RPC12/RpoP